MFSTLCSSVLLFSSLYTFIYQSTYPTSVTYNTFSLKTWKYSMFSLVLLSICLLDCLWLEATSLLLGVLSGLTRFIWGWWGVDEKGVKVWLLNVMGAMTAGRGGEAIPVCSSAFPVISVKNQNPECYHCHDSQGVKRYWCNTNTSTTKGNVIIMKRFTRKSVCN